MKEFFQKYGLLALTLFTFFFLLGSRSLNEPDEGRYGEIAREMVETGDWVVPHLWYVPHLDKPPMTYWLVAASIKIFGANEWAVRLPLALAGISGIFATFLLGCSIGGRKVGIWSALILQSSMLYFLMGRMLTTDIFLTALNVWAMYFFWRSWLAAKENEKREIILWQFAGWIFVAFAFLTKGPIAIAIPAVSFLSLLIFRRNEIYKKHLFTGVFFGFVLFLILTAPWFLIVFQRVPESANFMIFGQAAGHLLGTTIKNRLGSPFYFFGILAVGLLPWTLLLGWLWRRNFWRNLDANSKDGWVLLNAWAIFTFALFSLSHAKLPAYILPIFPALAVTLALKFFDLSRSTVVPAKWIWQLCLFAAFLPPIVFPLLLKFIFKDELPAFLKWQILIAAGIAITSLLFTRKWSLQSVNGFVVGCSLIGFFIIAAEIPRFETTLKANQTLKPLGLELAKNFQPGDAIVCVGKFPQGLPFYAGSAISATNRPYLCHTDVKQVPFEFPGNRERMADLYLPDAKTLAQFLQNGRRVWIVSFGNTMEVFRNNYGEIPLHSVARFGQWELSVNR